ncbi:MAG: hypothetical protein SF162_09550 [bacterium]|nr:hypothetical protein [bacterium]
MNTTTLTPEPPAPPKLTALQMIEVMFGNPAFIMIVLVIVILGAMRVLQINDTDNLFQSRASWNVYANRIFPFQDTLEQARTVYFHPAHTAFLTAPFLMFGRYIAAFFNVLFIMMLLIGERRGWAVLATLPYIVAPPLVVVFAAVNMPGVTTALGLIFILAGKRSPLRGYAWALLACRPQDNVLTLVYDGLRALRGRDWGAFLFAAGLMLPTLVTLGHWLSILPTSSTRLAINPAEFYTMSLPINIGVIPAVLIVAAIIGWRLIVIRVSLRGGAAGGRVRIARRAFSTITLTERIWLTYVLWLLLMPYFLAYVLWVMLIPLRLFSARRTLIAFPILMGIGAFTFNTLVYDSAWIPALLTTITIAALTPKDG